MLRGFVATLLLSLVAFGPTHAADQDRVRDAVKSGEARPLAEILPRLRDRFPGQLLDARLDQGGGPTRYVVKIIGPSGQVSEITVDAKSGVVLGVR